MAKVIQAEIPCDEAHVRFYMALSVRSINIRLSFSVAYLHASFRLYYVFLWSTHFLPVPYSFLHSWLTRT